MKKITLFALTLVTQINFANAQMEFEDMVNAYINKDYQAIVSNCKDYWDVSFEKVYFKDKKTYSDRIFLKSDINDFFYYKLDIYRTQEGKIKLDFKQITNSWKFKNNKDEFMQMIDDYGRGVFDLAVIYDLGPTLLNNICNHRFTGLVPYIGSPNISRFKDEYCNFNLEYLKKVYCIPAKVLTQGNSYFALVSIKYFYEKAPPYSMIYIEDSKKINNYKILKNEEYSFFRYNLFRGDSIIFKDDNINLDSITFYNIPDIAFQGTVLGGDLMDTKNSFADLENSKFNEETYYTPIKFGENSGLTYSKTKGEGKRPGDNSIVEFNGYFTDYELATFFSLDIVNSWKFIPLAGNPNHGEVIVEINGTKKKYLIDSGASFFTISETMAQEYILTESAIDLNSYVELEIADGSILKAKKIVLKRIKLGGVELENILAVVVPNETNLLGMSVLNKFKTWELDLKNQYLTVRLD